MTGRVAIYAVPGTGSDDPVAVLLRERAEAWLGRAVDRPVRVGATAGGWSRTEIDAITVDARRYGFHGTLKPPFRLAAGATLDDLGGELASFAAERGAVTIPSLRMTRLDDFFALVPAEEVPAIHDLADDLVTGFDRFRAPATDAEIARRKPDDLSPRRRELLAAWGYPFVLDEFRFHLTLTDRIPTDREGAVQEVLADWFKDCLGRPIALDALALLVEPSPGAPFDLHSLHRLRQTSDARMTSDPVAQQGSR